MKKKLLSLALALALALTVLPAAALADDWDNAAEVKSYEELAKALEDDSVEEIKITGEVVIPAADEPLLVETPMLVAKGGKLTMAPDAVMYVHVPMGRFSFEDTEHTWDLVAEMCETFIIWHPEEDTYNRDIFGTQPDIPETIEAAQGEPVNTLVISGEDTTLTMDITVEGTLQVIGHDLTIAKGVKVEAGTLFVDGDLTLEEGASLTVGEGSSITGTLTCAEDQIPENLDYPAAAGSTPSEPAAPAANPFTDVAETSPFYSAILWAVDEGITNGTTPTTFGPSNTCSVSNILTFLWRANGKPGAASGVSDRDAARAWGVEKRMVTEDQDISAPCTRIMAVSFMWIAAGEPEAQAEAGFTDLAAGADYLPAVNWAVERGVTTGTSASTFSPDNTCTRGQIVTFLYRAAHAASASPEQAGSGTAA